MDRDTETFDPQQSLRTISEAIDMAKKSISENGFYFLFWGVLVIAASLTDWYLLNVMGRSDHGLPWLSMMLIGLPGTLIYGWLRRRRGRAPGSLVGRWYGLVWLGFGVSMFISMAAAGVAGVSPVPFILLLAGFATFVSGALLQFRPLCWGGAALWAGAVACFWVRPEEHLLVEAVAIFLGYIVPGLLLNRQYRLAHAP